MKHNLVLVELNEQQIQNAKKANGERKKITHALVCGPHGQIVGTEKQCRKYFDAWINVFPLLFDKRVEFNNYQIENYESTFNLVVKLCEIHDPLASKLRWAQLETMAAEETIKKKGFFSKLFG